MAYKFIEIETKNVELKNGQNLSYPWLYLNNPPLNVLGLPLLEEIADFLENLKKETRLLVITGKGKAFAAGADISQMSQMQKKEAYEYSRFGQMVFQKLEQIPLITIACVNGYALGGGLELALACDIRIFAQKAVVGLPEVSLGLIPGFGGTVRLKKLVGDFEALYLILTGEKISAEEAYEKGLAQKVVSDADLVRECENLCQTLLQNGPFALRKVKELFIRGHSENALYLDEANAFSELFAIGEAKEGLLAFLEKRPAKFPYEG